MVLASGPLTEVSMRRIVAATLMIPVAIAGLVANSQPARESDAGAPGRPDVPKYSARGIQRGLPSRETFLRRVRVADDTKIARVEFGEVRNATLGHQAVSTPCSNFENGFPVPCVRYEPVRDVALQVAISVDGTLQNTNSDVSESGAFANLIVSIPSKFFDPGVLAGLPRPGMLSSAKNRDYVDQRLVELELVMEPHQRRELVKDCPHLPDTSVQADASCRQVWRSVLVPGKYLLIRSR